MNKQHWSNYIPSAVCVEDKKCLGCSKSLNETKTIQ